MTEKHKDRRVLIVGDKSREEVARILRRRGFSPDVAPDAVEAIDSLEIGNYEVVLIAVPADLLPSSLMLEEMKRRPPCCLLVITEKQPRLTDSAARVIQRIIPTPVNEHDLLDSVYGVINA